MSISALFSRRIRGVRLVNLWGAGLLLVLVVTLYLLKTFAGGERADIASTEMQIANEQRKIRLLHAEVAYLEQPARIGHLSEQYLGMKPASGKHETTVDSLGQIVRAPPPATPAAAPAAPAPSAPAPGVAQ